MAGSDSLQSSIMIDMPSVNTRINLSGQQGTIRFVGEVSGTTGIWLGVEWDDPQRGKHDGVKDGHRYFTCLIPNSGSFIRPSSTINYGVSFLHALVSKYIETPHGSQTQEIVLLGSSNGVIEVEAVGLDKIRRKFSQLERLREVSLDIENVATADPPGEIKKRCPNIRGLDLRKNLFPSWDIVALIASELVYLGRLALNQNRLVTASNPTLMSTSFLNLTELQLNGTLTTWHELINSLLPFMPKLEVVEFGYNLLHYLSNGQPQTKISSSNIQTLNLDGNNLSDWREISISLEPFPALTRLILISNGLSTIMSPIEGHFTGLSHLKHIALSSNSIKSWSCIDALTLQCPRLESLGLTGNPLLEDKNYRAFVVARIGSLTSFNGTTITQKERTDCELFYISYIAQHGPVSDEERAREHPRYRELCRKHDTMDTTGTPLDKRQDTLGNRLIGLNIHCTPIPLRTGTIASSVAISSSTLLQVLPSMNLRTLRLKICKTFKVSTKTVPSLYLQMDDGVVSTLETEQDSYNLTWWGLIDGANIFVYIANK